MNAFCRQIHAFCNKKVIKSGKNVTICIFLLLNLANGEKKW